MSMIKTGNMISIHAPLTGSDKAELAEQVEAAISIHAPLTGSDSRGRTSCILQMIFQSTLPSQGATFPAGHSLLTLMISIHAPLTGSDGLLL